jgi:phosphoglycolate phosphatase
MYGRHSKKGRTLAYKAVIFDLDGTLLNTLDDLKASTNFALAQHCLPARTTDEVRQFVGNGIRNLIKLAVSPHTSEDLIDAVHATFDKHYDAHHLDQTTPYRGVVELVQRLRASGIGCCVVSNKGDYAVQPLVQHFFPGLFDVVCGEREREGIRRKPWPDTVQTCMRTLGVDPEDCVYIGDSEVDVLTASNAGIAHIIVTWGFRDESFLREHGAKVFARSIGELERLISAGEPQSSRLDHID